MSKIQNGERRNLPFPDRSYHRGSRDHVLAIEDESMQSIAVSAASSIATGISSTQKNAAAAPPSSRLLDPVQELLSKSSNEWRASNDSGVGLCRVSTADLKRSIEERKRTSEDGRRFNPGESSLVTIPSPASLVLSDSVFVMNHAMADSFLPTEQRSSSLRRSSSIGIRTPFEVDDARGETRDNRRAKGPRRSASISSRSGSSPLDSHLSVEQDAWAGIDELLETRSVDNSYCFSTSDILPSATVQAMRRSANFDDETVWEEDNSQTGESAVSSEFDGFKVKQGKKANQESWNSKEDRERTRNDADLFRMFTWSHKDNVDEQRTRKVKLNSNALKLQMLAAQRRIPPQEPDSTSLPSLATFRPDDFSVVSGAASLDWSTYHSNASSFLMHQHRTTDDLGFGTFHDFNIQSTISEESFNGESFAERSSPQQSQEKSAGDGLVLDKVVDEYIRKIQHSLRNVPEDSNTSLMKGKKKKEVGFALDEGSSSPSPTSVIPEESPLDELPSFAAFSSSRTTEVFKVNTEKKGRKEEKKDPKPASLTFLMNSIKKKVTTKIKSSRKMGDEAKYFPEAVEGGGNTKKFSANRCLLNEGGDGVNWDAD